MIGAFFLVPSHTYSDMRLPSLQLTLSFSTAWPLIIVLKKSLIFRLLSTPYNGHIFGRNLVSVAQHQYNIYIFLFVQLIKRQLCSPTVSVGHHWFLLLPTVSISLQVSNGLHWSLQSLLVSLGLQWLPLVPTISTSLSKSPVITTGPCSLCRSSMVSTGPCSLYQALQVSNGLHWSLQSLQVSDSLHWSLQYLPVSVHHQQSPFVPLVSVVVLLSMCVSNSVLESSDLHQLDANFQLSKLAIFFVLKFSDL